MALPDVTFNRTNGIGAQPQGADHKSGMLFYSDTLPAGFAADDRVKKIYSLTDAENLGITNNYDDETVATGGNVEITTAGAAGTISSILVAGVVIGAYTVVTSDDASDVATGLRAAINALTSSHGFVAAGSGANVALTAPAGLGVILNATILTFTSTGAGAATVTQFSTGVGSLKLAMHYHISEYYRMRGEGELYIGIYAVPTTFDGDEIRQMNEQVNGDIRQIGVYYPNATFASSQVSAINGVLVTERTKHRPLIALMHSDMDELTISSLSDLSLLSYSKCGVVLSEDGNWHQPAYSATKKYLIGQKVTWLSKSYICQKEGTGYAPYDTSYWAVISENIAGINGYSTSTLGNALGTIALSPVHESIAYVEKYDISDGNTLDETGFATGDMWKNVSDSVKSSLYNSHYIFARKFQGISGTFYSSSFTAISITDDYATIENNRVMNKAERLVYTALVPKLNSPLYVNPEGTLRKDTIDLFDSIASNALSGMLSAGEISAAEVTINANQNVLQTSKLQITLRIVPVGVAREIEVSNSYVVKLTT